MFEGETIKINEKWYFYVGDCLVYKKTNMVVQSYTKRYEILRNILSNDYVSDSYMEPFELIRKYKYEYEDILGVKNGLISSLPFRVNGYVFKCLEAASYDILYIFPECRNKQPDDESPKNGGNYRSLLTPPNVGNDSSQATKKSIGNDSSQTTTIYTNDIIQSSSQSVKQHQQKVAIIQTKGKDEAKFLMKKTEFPDVYEIYMFDNSNSKKAKVGYAGIPNIECSVMVKNWFQDKEELYAKCKKNPVNEKWIPVQLV
jgi:hypothetical protein